MPRRPPAYAVRCVDGCPEEDKALSDDQSSEAIRAVAGTKTVGR